MQRLIMFVKAPRPGHVKTRLANGIGPKAACEVYRALVARVVAQIASLPEVQLRFSPDDAAAEIEPWRIPGWRLASQGSGDLGERLNRAFAEAFAEGCSRVVAIGSDCPDVTADDVRQAWHALDEHDAVLGPALDGGYWLIGLKKPCAGIFQGIDWSSERVFAQTASWLRANGKSYHLLRELADVDTEEDWKLYLQPSR